MKEKFAEGDVVMFKGFEPSPDTIMVVDRVNWKTTSSGRMKGTTDAPFLDSITVKFYDEKGNLILKDVHSHEIIKASLSPIYHIQKAIEQTENVSIKTRLEEILKDYEQN